ncbi:MAG: hypothetical protein Q7S40_17560 [Opitutaceae bacterium]|nr:hypothetical protein [Opitutaceae bacterium]
MKITRAFFVFILGCLATRSVAQPSGASVPPPALDGAPPASAVFATDQPASGFWFEHWFERTLEAGNPPVSARFRVNDPFAAFQKNFKDRKEVRANGMMQIAADLDVTTIRAAELYLELWGGHAGTANKRVTANGRTVYVIPENGTAAHECTHQYPSIPLRITDVIRGHNAFQFACDRGGSFWGHFIVDEACLRFELPVGHAALAAAHRDGFAARVDVRPDGETMVVSLVPTLAGSAADIESVEYHAFYAGYDECGAGAGPQWHGFTKRRETLGHVGTARTPPYQARWDVAMIPAQRDVAMRAVVRFKSVPALVYRTPVLGGLEITARPGVEVGVFPVTELPKRFWSRDSKPKTAVIAVPIDPGKIERAALHTVSWTGGPGEVKEYFKLNNRHFAVAEGHDHRTQYTVFPVELSLLRQGDNTIEVLSDTKEHGIELLSPGPALVVRYRK